MVERYIGIVRDTNEDILALVNGDSADLPTMKYFSPTDAVVRDLNRYLHPLPSPQSPSLS